MDKWIGDKKNGVELRYDGAVGSNGLEYLDELLLWQEGKVIMHMEATSEVNYWFGFYLDQHEVHMNVGSRNCRSYIDATAETVG